MQLPIYQIDAFTDQVFRGNPAAVCPLETWLPDHTMQAIALENNLSETAFFVPTDTGYQIRWFTPNSEVDLCGHATLASAYALYHLLGHAEDRIRFSSRSGELTVAREGDSLVLDFPAQPPVSCPLPAELARAFTTTPMECLQAEDYLLRFETQADIAALTPDMAQLKKVGLRGVIATAPSAEYDFVCRFFSPKYDIPEDPVTGSAFTQLVPYWSSILGKTRLRARQISSRGGDLLCENCGDRVKIAGRAVLYLSGTIYIA